LPAKLLKISHITNYFLFKIQLFFQLSTNIVYKLLITSNLMQNQLSTSFLLSFYKVSTNFLLTIYLSMHLYLHDANSASTRLQNSLENLQIPLRQTTFYSVTNHPSLGNKLPTNYR